MLKVAQQYPATTVGKGGQMMEPTILDDGTKEFVITSKVVDWEVEPGKIVKAWTYNGVVPAPEIHVNSGEQGAHRAQERTARQHVAALPRHPGAQRDGRRRPVHRVAHHPRRRTRLRLCGQGAGCRHLPLPPQRTGADPRRHVRCVHDRQHADSREADRQGLHPRSTSG